MQEMLFANIEPISSVTSHYVLADIMMFTETHLSTAVPRLTLLIGSGKNRSLSERSISITICVNLVTSAGSGGLFL
jgi:hypothetical protein